MAGGRGERMQRSGGVVPKALTPIADDPLIAHLCRYLSTSGITRIVVALGNRAAEMQTALDNIKKKMPDVGLAWRDTGVDCGNGGRLRRLGSHTPDQTFLMCWCDGLTDFDLQAMLAQHRRSRCLATVMSVQEPPRWGQLDIEGDRVVALREKADADRRWINGGFFLLEPEAIGFVHDDSEAWEHGGLQRLIEARQLGVWRHRGFWAAVDSLADCEAAEAGLRSSLKRNST